MDMNSIIKRFGLMPHPEGGHYVESYRSRSHDGQREAVSVIYFLLGTGEMSHWHKVDADEIWSFHAGAPAILDLARDGSQIESARLGIDGNAHPHVVVPKGVWQRAHSTGDWTFFSCVVAPAFQFGGFELAPPEWTPCDP